MPSPVHSHAELKLGVAVDPFNRRPGSRGPGGWWIFTEIHVGYPAEPFDGIELRVGVLFGDDEDD